MENNQKIVIGDKTITLKELFEGKQRLRKEQANLSFEKKIKALINLQKIAHSWSKKEDVTIWKL